MKLRGGVKHLDRRKASSHSMLASSLLWGLVVTILYVGSRENAAAVTPIEAQVRFSDNRRRVTLSYQGHTWTLHRPHVPSSDFPVLGDILWVAPGGDNDNPGTLDRPFKTIKRAVAAAGAGDIVYIRAGTYVENLVIRKSGQTDKPLVISASPEDIGRVKITPSASFVAANPHGAVIQVVSGAQYVWINGLVIEGPRGRPEAPASEMFGANGITWSGGAGFGNRATNNVVYNNVHCGLKEMGHGGTNILMEGNIIFENGTESRDHGIYAPSDDTQIIGNIIFNNTGWGIHSYSAPSRQLIIRNVAFWNGSGGILLAANHSEVYHNVFAMNTRGIMYFRGGCAFNIVKNNIFAFNTWDGQYDNGGGTLGDPHDNVDDYNCYSKDPDARIPPGPNEIIADPLFMDPEKGDFRLKSNSPCIDRGAYVGSPFHGSAPDMGAWEHSQSANAPETRVVGPRIPVPNLAFRLAFPGGIVESHGASIQFPR